MASIKKRPDGTWRARYRDDSGKEHAKHFRRKIDGQQWLDEVTASIVAGTHVAPKDAKMSVNAWSAVWLKGYGQKRPSTVRQAKVHLKHIQAAFGSRELASLRPSEVKAWTVKLKESGLADSTVYALHQRLGQLYSDAVHDGIVARSPVSRRTSPGGGKQRPYVATTEQAWALHDAMPEGMRPAILLAAFAGLRVAEAVALRVKDVDFMRGVVSPVIQYPEEPLKTETSRTPIPISTDLALELNRMPAKFGSETIVTSEWGRGIAPYTLESYFRKARATVEGLPEGFRYHDLRHYYASLLIASGLDVKVVQRCMRHASAKTTLDTYGHMFPDKEDSARHAVTAVLAERRNAAEGAVRTG